ncbi:MAG: hypothetical protein R3A47_04835 [Polyangiales bacterium]
MNAYHRALKWLYSLEHRGARMGLRRDARCGDRSRHPSQRAGCAHRGDERQGSVNFSAAALRAEGFRVGQFVSPHLQRFVERVRVDGRPISEAFCAKKLAQYQRDEALNDSLFWRFRLC